MKHMKLLLVVVGVIFFFPLVSSAELNNAKNEDNQVLTFDIVGNDDHNERGDEDGGSFSLPKTDEKKESFLLKGIGLISIVIILSRLFDKRGNQYDH